MDNKIIISEILARAEDLQIIRRANRILKDPSPREEAISTLIRMARQEPGVEYPPEIVQAMDDFEATLWAKRPENRTVTMQIRCTVNERNIIRLLAAREGKTVSEFVRDRCLTS